MEQEKLTSAIESILFLTERPVTITRLMEVFGEEVVSEQELLAVVDGLKEKFSTDQYGFEIREAGGGYYFCTKPVNADWIRKFLQMKPFRLGKSALETMAIIAYRQPITRAEIDQVRGIDSSHLLRTLIERGLVKMAGKAELPGRPVQYGTTPRFLEVMGLNAISELPPLSELEQIQGHTQDTTNPMEAGLDKFVAESANRSEVEITGEDTTGLEEIDQLIQSVQKPDTEIYESQLHADVARENQAAHEGFLAFMRPHRRPRKSEVTAEEVTEITAVTEVAAGEIMAAELVTESTTEVSDIPEIVEQAPQEPTSLDN